MVRDVASPSGQVSNPDVDFRSPAPVEEVTAYRTPTAPELPPLRMT